jgi:hypothetical protein
VKHRPRRDRLSGPGLGDEREGAAARLQNRGMNEVQVAASCLDLDGEVTVEEPHEIGLVERPANELIVTADEVSGRVWSRTDDLVPERATPDGVGLRRALQAAEGGLQEPVGPRLRAVDDHLDADH